MYAKGVFPQLGKRDMNGVEAGVRTSASGRHLTSSGVEVFECL
jgi:hypothetical protein